jgi:ABC-type nitrate/sulfonate/bicarbonate transport system substrate-binding protein
MTERKGTTMQWNSTRHVGLLVCAALVAGINVVSAQDVPTIRFGRQTAAEDNLWLMLAKPSLAPNLGKAYKIEWNQFRASDAAFKAFEAGQADFVSASANAAIAAATGGVDLKIVASLSREAESGAKTQFLVKKDGPREIAELKGKTICIVGHRSSVELWARQALRKGGLNPDRDINFAVVPFPAVADAVRTGRIEAGGAPDVFAQPELAKGDVKSLFTSKTGMPFDEELILVLAQPEFLKKHPAAVRALLSDLVTVNKYYLANLREARQALLDAKLVALPPAMYFNLIDYVRDPGLRPSVENLHKQQDVLVSSGFVQKRIDLEKVVDSSYLGNH